MRLNSFYRIFVKGSILLLILSCFEVCAMAADLQDLQYSQVSQGDTNFTDKKGQKQGLWIRRDSSRNLFYKGVFENDMPKGWFIYTDHNNLKVADVLYFRGGYASYNRYYYPNGKTISEGYYLDKQKDSIWVYYREDGSKIKEEKYKNGLLDGVASIYGPNNELMEEMPWFRGLRHGNWWKKESQGYQSGMYRLNKSYGEYKAFYPDSSLYIKGYYDDGTKQGLWSFYLPSPSKSLYKEDVYRENKLLKRTLFLKFGNKLNRISMDTIVAVFPSSSGSGDIFTQSGQWLHSNESFETVCKILDIDYFFYANPSSFVAYKFVKGLVAGDEGNRVDMEVSMPFPIYADEDGVQTIKSVKNETLMGVEDAEK